MKYITLPAGIASSEPTVSYPTAANTKFTYNSTSKTDTGIPADTFNNARFIPIVGVGKRDAYELVHGDLPRQHPFGITLRFTASVPGTLGSERHRYAMA